MPEAQEIKEYASFPGLKDAVNKLKGPASPAVEQKVGTANSVEPTEVSNSGTEVVKQSETVADTPKEDPKVKPTTAVEETVAVDKPWDADDSTEPSTVNAPTIDYSKLGSALKLEGIKSESDIVSKFNELQTKLQEVESKKAATLEGLPDELKEVIDLAKSGVDWRSYLGASTVDWKKVDPIDLFESEFEKSPHYRNPDGTINQDLLNTDLDSIPDAQKAFEGNRMINQKLNEQQYLKNQQAEQARVRKEQSDRALIEATKSLSEILPESQFGVKFEAKHSDYLFKGISSGELLQKHFMSPNGGYDMKKVARTIALAEYGDKMIKFQAEKAKVSAKKEILSSTQNVQLESSKTSVAPDDGSEAKVSITDKFTKFMNAQKGVGHL
jgi:hypothetical protein